MSDLEAACHDDNEVTYYPLEDDVNDPQTAGVFFTVGVNTEVCTKDIGLKLWSSGDDELFFPVAKTFKQLPPDLYEIAIVDHHIAFLRSNFVTEDLILFDDINASRIVSEIENFWSKANLFKKFGFPHRRGILLYGPPGGGKSSITKLIIQQIIERGGIAIKFNTPDRFIKGMRVLRSIQPQVPVVVVMEDIDSIVTNCNISSILNILDGVDSFENVVYIATTNYPETLEGRIKNRPSRFDRRYKVGLLNDTSRGLYLKHLLSKTGESELPNGLERWIKDTNGFTPAHIKELFVSVKLFACEYDEILKILKNMYKKVSSENDIKSAGFGSIDY